MAYFAKINSLLQPQNTRASDLLLPQNQQQQEEQPGQPPASSGMSRGSNMLAPGNRAEAGLLESEYTKLTATSKGAASKALVDANKGQTAADASDYGGNLIADQQKALQAEADKYKTSTEYKPVLAGDDLSKAANGDADAFGKVDKVLNVVQAPPAAFAYNNGAESDNEKYVRGLNETTKLQNLMKQNNANSADYNEQSAAIDGFLLGNSSGFKDQRDKMIGDYAVYDKAKGDAGVTATTQATAFTAAAAAEKERTSKALAEMGSGIQGSIDTKLVEAKAAKKADNDRIRAEMLAEQEAIKQEQLKYFAANPGIKLDDVADVGGFYNAGNDGVDLGDVTSAEDISRFNKIQNLLKGSGSLSTAKGAAAGPSFDAAGYKAAMNAAYAKNREKYDTGVKLAKDTADMAVLNAQPKPNVDNPAVGDFKATIAGGKDLAAAAKKGINKAGDFVDGIPVVGDVKKAAQNLGRGLGDLGRMAKPKFKW